MINLHNHTTFSDGTYSPEEIARAALGYRFTHVAITDYYHTSRVRSIPPEQLEEYIATLRALAARYTGRIKVLVGVEIDSCPERCDPAALPFGLLNKLDFVFFEYVQDDLWNGMSLWELLRVARPLTVPIGLAHNDIAKNFEGTDYGVMIPVLECNRMFVELCTSPKYSRMQKQYYHHAEDFFARLRGTGASVSVGSDTHHFISEVGAVSDGLAFVERLGLQNNLVTRYFESGR